MAGQKDGMELIDGHLGKPHIDSGDMSRLHIGLNGKPDLVFNWGDKLAATAVTSSAVTIGTGCGQIQGMYFTVTVPQNVSLKDGNTVYLHYFHDPADDTETIDMVSGTGKTEGVYGSQNIYMPLYTISGGQALKLFNVIGAGSGGGLTPNQYTELKNDYDNVNNDLLLLNQNLPQKIRDELKKAGYNPGHVDAVEIPTWVASGNGAGNLQYVDAKITHNMCNFAISWSNVNSYSYKSWDYDGHVSGDVAHQLGHLVHSATGAIWCPPVAFVFPCIDSSNGTGKTKINAIRVDTNGTWWWCPLYDGTMDAGWNHHASCCIGMSYAGEAQDEINNWQNEITYG